MNILIVSLFCIYTVVLAIASFILLQFIAYFPFLVLLGAIPKGFAYSIFRLITIAILPLLCEGYAIYIWVKTFKYLKTSKSSITPELKKNVFWMIILTVILSSFIGFYLKNYQNAQEDLQRNNEYQNNLRLEMAQYNIEHNQNAALTCKMVEGLCVTSERIAYNRGDTLNDSLNNAKKVCSDLGMRVPTKEEYDLLLSPLTDFKDKLEHNPSDEEFVDMAKYYKNSLKEYHLQFWSDNFLTSSMVDGKAITYKVDLKRYYNQDGCRVVHHVRGVYGTVCISETVDTPVIEYHNLNESIDKTKYSDYSLHCVK